MTARLWFPQLDVFDCVRRLSAILHRAPSGMHTERLYILDFFFANVPLLHRTTMKADVRAKFRNLKIKKPNKSFVAFPAPQLLFHQMEQIQRDGLSAMAGKGLVSISDLRDKSAKLTPQGLVVFEDSISKNVTDEENRTIDFLVDVFGNSEQGDIRFLRNSTGLRRAS